MLAVTCCCKTSISLSNIFFLSYSSLLKIQYHSASFQSELALSPDVILELLMDTIKTLCFNPHLLLPFRSSSPFWLMGHKSLFDVVCSVRLLFFYFPLSGLAVNLRRPFDIHLLQADLSDPGFFFSLHAINLCRFRENSCHSGQWQYCSFPCMFPPTAETSTVTPGGCVPDVPSG